MATIFLAQMSVKKYGTPQHAIFDYWRKMIS